MHDDCVLTHDYRIKLITYSYMMYQFILQNNNLRVRTTIYIPTGLTVSHYLVYIIECSMTCKLRNEEFIIIINV